MSACANENGQARATCKICPHACTLSEGQCGLCRARVAHEGSVRAQNYGRITSLALDPIEKKPLARFYPGSKILSVGSYGCNLACPFCQNASIAQVSADEVAWRELSPRELVDVALAYRDRGNIGIAFTYNEPLVGYEYVVDTARLAHDAGLKTVLVSNGYVNPEALEGLLGLIDAANIDLKGFDESFYRMLGAPRGLETVCGTIEKLALEASCHVEVTTLVIPGKNDDLADMDRATAWLASISNEIPYHVTRFFPCYRMADALPTPRETVYALADVARKHLRHVYVGNC